MCDLSAANTLPDQLMKLLHHQCENNFISSWIPGGGALCSRPFLMPPSSKQLQLHLWAFK